MNESIPLNPPVHNPPQQSGTAGGAIGERIQPEAPSRFESKPSDFVGIAGPTLVYIGVAKREDFDKIAADCVDGGQAPQGHVLTKTINRFSANEVTVVFQHWLNQLTIDAMIADMKAKRGEQVPEGLRPAAETSGPLIDWKTSYEEALRQRDALTADAERYRFLRKHTWVEAYWIDGAGGVDTKTRVTGCVDHLDLAVDMERIKEHPQVKPHHATCGCFECAPRKVDGGQS